MHYVSLNNYMMKIVDIIWVVLMCYLDVWSAKICGLIKGLLRMYGVMGMHMFIAIVDKDFG